MMILFNLGNDCSNLDRLEQHIIYHYLHDNSVNFYTIFHKRNNFMQSILSSTIKYQCLPLYYQ